jgi:hypothetical protein
LQEPVAWTEVLSTLQLPYGIVFQTVIGNIIKEGILSFKRRVHEYRLATL